MKVLQAVLLGVLTLAGQARASDVADEAEFHFRRGLSLQRRGQTEEALAEFYASNRLVANRNVQVNIASALGRLGHFEEAFRAYSQLEGQALSAEERAEVDRALGFLRPKLALVRVGSNPAGATIYVERVDLGALGTTPKTLALKPGRAKILLELDGYRPAAVEVVLEKGQQGVAAPELERIFGQIHFTSIPANAEVRCEGATGELLLRGPGKLRREPGRVALQVTARGFLASRLEVDVPRDATRVVDLTLAPEPPPARKVAALVIRANLDGALVRVDGKEMGFTPVVIEGVEVGLRFIEVTREGREPFTQELDLKDQERRFLDVTLRPKRLVVAGATQRLIRLEDAPASMTVITADEIRAFGYRTVAEALRSVRGLHVWSDRARDSVGMRGFGLPEGANSRVLVLLNGHPMNDLLRGFGPVGAELGIDLTQVERIEVVRGGGMVFGSTAYLGLVNVVTREPEPGVHAQLGGSTGTFGGFGGGAAVSGRGGWGEVLVLVGGAGGEGSPIAAPGGLLSDESGSSDLHLFGRIGGLSLTAGATRREKQLPVGYEWSNGEPVTLDDGRAFAALQYDRRFDGGSFLLVRAALDQSGYSADYHPQGTVWKMQTGQANGLSGELRFEWALSRTHRVTLGAAGRDLVKLVMHAASSEEEDPLQISNRGGALTLYASDEWRPREGVQVHAGMRIDPVSQAAQGTFRAENLAVSLLPHFALLGQPYAGGNTKLLLGATARAPSEYENRFGHVAFGRRRPIELAAEERYAVELEHSHAMTDETSLTAALFMNSYTRLISSAPVEPGSSEQVLGNSSEGSAALGGELEVRYAPGDGKLASLSGVVQGSRLKGGSQLVNFPEHVVSGRFALPVIGQNLRASTELVFVGARIDRRQERIDESLYWNVILSGEYAPWRTSYYGGVLNLLDERLPDPVGPELVRSSVPRYGREVWVGAYRRF